GAPLRLGRRPQPAKATTASRRHLSVGPLKFSSTAGAPAALANSWFASIYEVSSIAPDRDRPKCPSRTRPRSTTRSCKPGDTTSNRGKRGAIGRSDTGEGGKGRLPTLGWKITVLPGSIRNGLTLVGSYTRTNVL